MIYNLGLVTFSLKRTRGPGEAHGALLWPVVHGRGVGADLFCAKNHPGTQVSTCAKFGPDRAGGSGVMRQQTDRRTLGFIGIDIMFPTDVALSRPARLR